MTPVKYFVAYNYMVRKGGTIDKGLYSEIVEVGTQVEGNEDLEDLTQRVQQDFCERMHAEVASITIITLHPL